MAAMQNLYTEKVINFEWAAQKRTPMFESFDLLINKIDLRPCTNMSL